MAESYTRQASFTDGDVIRAEHGNSEFNQLVQVFSESSGHNHDGTVQGGAPVPLIEDLTGTHRFELTATGFTSSVVLDEDDMVTNSDQRLATQQSIKAYADSVGAASNTYADDLDAANRTWTTSEIQSAVTGGVGGLVDTVNTWTALQTFNVLPQVTLDPTSGDEVTRKSWVDSAITTGIDSLNLFNITNGFQLDDPNGLQFITTTSSAIYGNIGSFSLVNNSQTDNLNLTVTNGDASVDTPITAVGDAVDAYALLRYGNNPRFQTTTDGAKVLNGTLSSKNDIEYRDHEVFRNSGSISIQGSLGTGSKITELWNWSVGGTYSLDESTFDIGDKVVFYKLYEVVPTMSIVTDEGDFYYNGTNEGDTITMDTGYKLKMECLKIDTANWVITAEVL